ncbi:exonuclease domain-containing protein [Neptunomonas marina]|uniref:3'-5' exonuclease n=1 Tax=Neptunomonas marina TaxID=1815562 RepID=UPI001F0BA2B3|nr:exonuclease domain-containing protein [Neptunomonas marina]
MSKDTFICLDIEASGLGPRSYPIEIAWADSGSDEHDTFLINPNEVEQWSDWDEKAQSIHNIPRESLVSGLSVREACSRLNARLAGCTVICDALEFDYFWMRRLFDAARMNPAFKLAGLDAVLRPEQLIYYRIVAKAEVRKHRALDDAYALMASMKQCLSHT